MATLSQTVRLIFEGLDRTGQATDSVVRNLDGISSATQSATGAIANLTTDILKFETAIIGAGAALVTYSAAISQDFERSFREIATLIDVPLEGLADFRSEILQYAQTSTSGLEEITSSIYQAVSAGVAWEESVKALAQAERLAIAGNTDLATGLDTLIPVLNAYGAGMDKAAGFSDLLFQTVRNGRTTIPELGASLSQVAPLAASAGVSFDEIAAAISTLTAAGAPTSQAITQIRSAISAYLKPSQQATELAEQLGLKFNASSLASKGLAKSIQEASAATGGSADKLALLFGSVEGLSAVLALGGTNAQKFTADLQANADAAGSVEAAYAKVISNLDTGADAGRAALVRLGDGFRVAFIDSKAALTDITNAIADSLGNQNFQELLRDIQAFGNDITAVLQEVARNLPAALDAADLSGFRDGLREISDALRRFFGDIDITTVDGLQAAIEKAGQAFKNLSIFTATTLDELKPFFKTFLDVVDAVVEGDEGLVSMAASFAGLALAFNTVLPILDTVLLTILAVGGTGGVVAKASAALGALSGVVKAGAVALAGFAASGAGVAAGIAGIGFAVGSVINDVTKVSDNVSDVFDVVLGEIAEQEKAVGSLRITAEDLGIVAKRAVEVGLGFEEAGRALGKYELENRDLIKTLDLENETLDRLERSFAEQGKIYDAATGEVKDFAGAVFEVATQQDIINDALAKGKIAVAQYTDETGELVRVYKDIGTSSEETKKSLGDLLTDALDSTEAFNAFADATGVARDKIAELAAEIRVAEIEAKAELDIAELESKTDIATAKLQSFEKITVAKVELDIAEVQANAQIAQASIAGISESAVAVNENIRAVIEAISGLDDADKLAFRKEQLFRDQLQRENELRDRLVSEQIKLSAAQVQYYQESTKRLRTGDALIKINGDGLEPELEAFMFAVLRRIQIVASQDQTGFLLGLPA